MISVTASTMEMREARNHVKTRTTVALNLHQSATTTTEQDSDVVLIEALNESDSSKKLLKTFPKVILRRMSEQEWIKVAKQEPKDPILPEIKCEEDEVCEDSSVEEEKLSSHENENAMQENGNAMQEDGKAMQESTAQVRGASPENTTTELSPAGDEELTHHQLSANILTNEDADRSEVSLIKELPPLLHQNQLKKEPLSKPEPIDEIIERIPESTKNIYIIDSSQAKQNDKAPSKQINKEINKYNGYNIIESPASLSTMAPQAVLKPSSFKNNKDCLKIQSKLANMRKRSSENSSSDKSMSVDVKPDVSPKYVDRSTSMDESPTVTSSSGVSSSSATTVSIGIQVNDDLPDDMSKTPQSEEQNKSTPTIIKRTMANQTNTEGFIEVLEPECMFMAEKDEKKLLFLREMELVYFKEYMKVRSRRRELEVALNDNDKMSDSSGDTLPPQLQHANPSPRSTVLVNPKQMALDSQPGESIEKQRRENTCLTSPWDHNGTLPQPRISPLTPTIKSIQLDPPQQLPRNVIAGNPNHIPPPQIIMAADDHLPQDEPLESNRGGNFPPVKNFAPPSYDSAIKTSITKETSPIFYPNQKQREEKAQETMAEALHMKGKKAISPSTNHKVDPQNRTIQSNRAGVKRLLTGVDTIKTIHYHGSGPITQTRMSMAPSRAVIKPFQTQPLFPQPGHNVARPLLPRATAPVFPQGGNSAIAQQLAANIQLYPNPGEEGQQMIDAKRQKLQYEGKSQSERSQPIANDRRSVTSDDGDSPCARCQNLAEYACSRCREARYCGIECQMKHWKESHMHECKLI